MNVTPIPRSHIAARDVAGWNGHRNNVLLVPSESMGGRVRRLRLASDRSQRQLAADAGVSQRVVLEAEANRTIRLGSFVALARALGCSLDSLWFGRGL